MAPPRPFGDPDIDTAKNNDQRKQSIDGELADPSDPNQQLGNQIGDPSELEDQASDAEAQGTVPPLTCTNCGTGIQPPAPQTGGEPPFPAEGDVCPVCKSGKMLSDQDPSEDADQDGIPDDEETGDQDAKNSDPKDPTTQSDDDSEDDDDDPQGLPFKKKDSK
jgi:hypothetical protein